MEYIGAERGDGEEACVLCAIPTPGHVQTNHVVERAELTFTVLNLYPYTSGHLMIVPFQHLPHLTDLDEAQASAVIHGVQRAVRALERAMSPHGFNIGVNHGQVAGAGLHEHVHMHVVPRWGGDTNFMSVIGDVRVIPEALDQAAEKIRAAYADGAGTAAAADGE
jgi:ATP adenylyltransferase